MNLRFAIILIVISTIGCHRNDTHVRLTRIQDIVTENPSAALDSLKRISRQNLSDADRHLYDLLTIKAQDKAFMPHTTDSLILDVVNYYESHSDKNLYPEALYYAGRVYHDLGDLPEALNYYYKALDYITSFDMRNSIKGNLLSQIAGVLNSMRLYDQTVPYLEEVIHIDSIRCDTINTIYDLEQLGSLYLHTEKYDSAEYKFTEAKDLAKRLSITDTIRHNMYLAAIKYRKDQNDSALMMIRPVIESIDSISRNVALSYGCYIYRKAMIPDTAFMYARELVSHGNRYNKLTGFQIILSDDMSIYLDVDSAKHYVGRYHRAIDEYLNKNGDNLALQQVSYITIRNI